MLLQLIERQYPLDIVVFYNTGMEFDSIYRIRDRVLPLLKERGVEFVELTPEEPFLFSMFERKVKYRNKSGYHYGFGWCGGACRWGTSFKLKAIRDYKASLNDIVTDYVGIAADETNRFDKAQATGKVLPLVEWGMTEAYCLDYCYQNGYEWDENGVKLYSILDRVSCWCCANKNRKELFNIYRYLPRYWLKLKEMQSRIDMPMKKFQNKKYGAYGNIFDMERVFDEEIQKEAINNG